MRSARLVLVATALCSLAYLAGYGVLRATHVFVHTSYWDSSEGLDFHHDHAVSSRAAPALNLAYAPLLALEARVHAWRQP